MNAKGGTHRPALCSAGVSPAMGCDLLRVGSIAHETWALQFATGADPWHPARMAVVSRRPGSAA